MDVTESQAAATPTVLRPTTPPLPLAAALAGIAELDTTDNVELRGVSLDTRLIRPGDLYVALAGTRAHGADFLPDAIEAGAVAVLTDRDGAERIGDCTLPVAVAADIRGAMARAADRIYAHPAEALTMAGITGTNGKTTTAFLLSSALQGIGHHVGTIGTLGFQLDGAALLGARTTVTTPESVDLHGLLALLRQRGADTVVMEVSSHAMALRRTEPIRFDVAAFTNLSPEHLDFHPTMADYFEAKATLFTPEHTKAAVINIDDEAGVRLVERVRRTPQVELRTLSWNGSADYRIMEVSGNRVRVTGPAGELEFGIALPGDFNVRNAVTALALTELAGQDVAAAAEQLASVTVPGRMQPVPLPPGAPAVFIDFAHTPEAVRSALAAFAPDRERGRRVVAVLGCGGDRDRVKRGPMGAAAARTADLVVVTDDNPRTEEPASIRAAVLAGAREVTGSRAVDGGDRRAAISLALSEAGADDVVVVLGKGHEQGQEIDGRIIPFDDQQVVGTEWARLEGDR